MMSLKNTFNFPKSARIDLIFPIMDIDTFEVTLDNSLVSIYQRLMEQNREVDDTLRCRIEEIK